MRCYGRMFQARESKPNDAQAQHRDAIHRLKLLLNFRPSNYDFWMKTLVCPHCGTHVPEHASICVGCSAEIVVGATRRERSTAGCLASVLALLVTMAIVGMGSMPDPRIDAALFLVLKFLALIIVANVLGRLAMHWAGHRKLRFFRKSNYRDKT